MAVYTSYDMIRDCQADRPEGWIYLVDEFAPAIATIARHYGGGPDATERILLGLKQGFGPLRTLAPCHQREFLYHLRPYILEVIGTAPPPAPAPDLEAVTEALGPLSAIERQAAWLETFGYGESQTAVLMRMAPETVAALRTRVAELLRARLDDWSTGLLARHGRALGGELEQQTVAEPLEFRHFLDVMDGRITWQRRTDFARQLETHWAEVHRACRIREADEALFRKTEFDADRHLAALGVSRPKPSRWKSLLSR